MRTKSLFTRVPFFILLITTLFVLVPPAQAGGEDSSSTLEAFIAAVQNGQPETLRGVYVPNVMAYPVVQQPQENSAFVSEQAGTVTEFNMARRLGNVGLLAHNTLAGNSFFKIQPGAPIILAYGAGRTETFIVEKILSYQKLPYGMYQNLETREVVGIDSLFETVYGGEYHLTLQTCVSAEGNNDWGRLFIIARPLVPAANAAKENNE